MEAMPCESVVVGVRSVFVNRFGLTESDLTLQKPLRDLGIMDEADYVHLGVGLREDFGFLLGGNEPQDGQLFFTHALPSFLRLCSMVGGLYKITTEAIDTLVVYPRSLWVSIGSSDGAIVSLERISDRFHGIETVGSICLILAGAVDRQSVASH